MIVEKPFRIGATIRELLMSSPKVREVVGDRVYPYTTQVDVIDKPHIVYDGIVVNFSSSKDGEYPETITMSIGCNTIDYQQGIDLAEAVIDAFEDHQDIEVTEASADYDAGALMFIHSITIQITVE